MCSWESTATGSGCGGATRAASSSARVARRGNHNERRPYIAGLVIDHFRREYRRSLVEAYRDRITVDDVTVAALLSRGEPAPEEWEEDLTDRLRRAPEVRAALERMWPILDGAELVNDLLGFEALIRSASKDVLTPDEQRLLLRDRVPDVRDVRWTDADLPLLDEADAILGPKSAARPRRRRRGRSSEAMEMARRTVVRARGGSHRERRAGARALRLRHARAARRRRRRAAHLRARARRRGAGPHRHAVADAGPPLPVGLDDAGRRLRPGEPHRRPRELGRRPQERHRAGAAPPGDPVGELPHPERDHGGREPPPARRRAGCRARPLGPEHRRLPGGRHGRDAGSRRRCLRSGARRARRTAGRSR